MRRCGGAVYGADCVRRWQSFSGGCMYTSYIGSGARFLARNLGIIEKYPYNAVVTADGQQAMEFLSENS